MAAQETGSDDAEMITGINVTPLVDVTLVLLIIFIVTAKLVVARAVPHDLPRAATAHETEVVFAVALDPAGAVSVEGRPIVQDQELRSLAAAALARDPDVRAVIQAAGEARHAVVVRVMDILRQAGLAKIGFAVDRSAPLPGSTSGSKTHARP